MLDGVKAVPPNHAVPQVPPTDLSNAHSCSGGDYAPTKKMYSVIGNGLDIEDK